MTAVSRELAAQRSTIPPSAWAHNRVTKTAEHILPEAVKQQPASGTLH
jgi:hypothetical protein